MNNGKAINSTQFIFITSRISGAVRGGCYDVGGSSGSPALNTDAGAGLDGKGGSGKVVVWYYTYE